METPDPIARIEDALLSAHEFVIATTAWSGNPEDRDEALTDLNDALFAVERLRENAR